MSTSTYETFRNIFILATDNYSFKVFFRKKNQGFFLKSNFFNIKIFDKRVNSNYQFMSLLKNIQNHS